MPKMNIQNFSDYWNKYDFSEVDYVSSEPKPKEVGLSKFDVEEIEHANDLMHSRAKRNRIIRYVCWCILSVLLFLRLFWVTYEYTNNLTDLIFTVVVWAVLAMLYAFVICVIGQLLIERSKNIPEFFGYKLTRQEFSSISDEKRRKYEEFVKKRLQYEYWQLIHNPDAWRDKGSRPHLLIRDILCQIGFHKLSYHESSYGTRSYLFSDGKDKVYINIKSDNELITEQYINSLKIDALEEDCNNIIVYTPNLKIAKDALATVMSMKDDNMTVEIYSPERFTARLDEFNI